MSALSLIVASLLLCGGDPEPVQVGPQEPDAWSWRIAPYLFAANVDGTLGVGPLEVETDADFSDLWNSLEIGGFLLIEAHRERFGLALDSAYLDFTEDGRAAGAEADLRLAMLALAGFYRLGPASPYEVALGLRYLDVEQELRVGAVTATGDSSVLDGFVGARAVWPLGRQTRFGLYGDVGAGESELTWQGVASLGYDFGSWGLNFGYRILDYDIEDGPKDLDVALEGWLFGVEYRL